MKPGIPLLILLGLAQAVLATTLAVLPGGSIQAKVDAAAPGDIIAIFGGTYPGDVTINKAIRLVEVDGQDVTITGNVTFTGITNAPPFEGFTVGSSGKGITISNTTGIVLKNIDARPGFGVVVNGTSKAGLTGGFYSQISQDGGELTATLTQVTGAFNTTINALKTVAFRNNVSGNYSWASKKAWLGYSTGPTFAFSGTSSKLVIVGCSFSGSGYSTVASLGGAGNNFTLLNSQIKGLVWGTHFYNNTRTSDGGTSVYISTNNNAAVLNSYITATNNSEHSVENYWTGTPSQGCGVFSASQNCVISNNIIIGALRGIYAPYGTRARNNFHSSLYYGLEGGGVVASDSVTGDPLFVSGQAPKLQPSSPCINTGVTDPIFNDLNGTRNDIGPSGGCLFDPDGWTTANPVVVSFDLAPEQLLKGVDTQVNLSNGQAVAQP